MYVYVYVPICVSEWKKYIYVYWMQLSQRIANDYEYVHNYELESWEFINRYRF